MPAPIAMDDDYTELLIIERIRFLEDKLVRGVRLFFMHGPQCAIAAVTRTAN